MQKDTAKTGVKCPECKGTGKLMKLWPLTAIAMPHELGWQRFTCWRCKGTGQLPEDDPYVRRSHVEPSKPWPRTACCANEKRNMNGGCDNCGDPCL